LFVRKLNKWVGEKVDLKSKGITMGNVPTICSVLWRKVCIIIYVTLNWITFCWKPQ